MEHIQKNAGRARPEKKSLSVGLACGQSEILDAQRLRYRVFAGEMGANLPSRTPGVDHDIYDPYCEHLVVRDTQSGAPSLRAIASHVVAATETISEFALPPDAVGHVLVRARPLVGRELLEEALARYRARERRFGGRYKLSTA